MERESSSDVTSTSALSPRKQRLQIGFRMLNYFSDPRCPLSSSDYSCVRSSSGILTYSDRELDPTSDAKAFLKVYRTSNGDVHVKLLEATVTPREFNSDKYFAQHKYFFVNHHYWVALDDLNLATHLARLREIKGTNLDISYHNSLMTYYWEDKITLKVDTEYAEASGGVPPPPTVTLDVTPLPPFDPEDVSKVDKELYNNFAKTLSGLLANKEGDNYAVRMGNTRTLSRISTPWTASQEFFKFKRQLTPKQWLDLAKGRVPAVSYQFPKPGNVTSSGQPRMVVAVEPVLEAWLRVFWNGVNFDRLPGYMKRPSDLRSDLRHSYDIRSSDAAVGPYFWKYVCDHYPDKAPLLFPRVVGKYGPYRSAKLPSGVPHTAIVTNAFCYALIKTLRLEHFQFQGDGFITNQDLSHPLLRRNKDHTLNGFTRKDATLRFVNTHKLAETVYLRPGKINGALRYRIRYSCYHHLNAIGLNLYPRPLRGILSPRQIQLLCDEYDPIVEAVTGNYRFCRANCETTVRDETTSCFHSDCSSLVFNTT